jgi:ketosteroid isomerase-like protein
MGAPSSIEVVRSVFDAFDAGDREAFIALLARDVVVRPPGFWFGETEFRGREQAGRSFDEVIAMRSTLERETKVRNRRFFVDRADETKTLAGMEIEVFEINSARSFGTEAAMLYTVIGGEVTRVDSFVTLEEGLALMTDPVAADA